ncbi:MAG TPA: TonB-dependent receptor plug domain-containing protein [Terracidiphilus sp.]|jgi:iron complex outermembrane receptor protein/vitamin B12 transporter
MSVASVRRLSACVSVAFLHFLPLPASTLHAQQIARLYGTVHDPLGAVVTNASVDLIRNGRSAATTKTNDKGTFGFAIAASGRYRIRASAPSFQPTASPIVYVSATGAVELNVTLGTPTLTQQVTVTATGAPTPEAQTGASVTVIPAEDFRYATAVQDPLRLVPGLQTTQTGQMGGTSGLTIRGGATDANKVLIDGIPANAIGGAVEFANLASVGIQSIEVLREPNSALYGSDALAAVVSLTTPRGSTAFPLITYAGDAGNFGTYRNAVTAGVGYRHFDLYSAFARVDTRNSFPNSEFHNATYAGNFGWALNPRNDLRFTLRHIIDSAGQPNAIALYGIPDDGQQKEQDNYYGAVWNSQTTDKWHNQFRYGGVRLNSEFNEFGATGIYDPAIGYWLGAPVSVSGANGYSVTGQAVFQYSDQPSQYLSPSSRDFVYAQSDYSVTPHLLALGAFKFVHEHGSAGDSGAAPNTIDRDNYSYTLQLTGDMRNRLFWNLGTGLEDNGLFGFAATPRASLAYYLVRPSNSGFFTGTKVHGSFGEGIKEPSVYQQANSLFGLLAPLPQGFGLIEQYSVEPLGAENSRTLDGGVDQQMLEGRALLGLTYFHNEFTNGVEYVPQAGLIELGIPAASLPPFAYGGAYINSLGFKSQGAEIEIEYQWGSHVFARGGYTYTDAVVKRSFSSDNLQPSLNTASAFSSIPIGADSPLVGARPFRIAPHSGYFAIHYTQSKFYTTFTGTLVGSRDDSDYLVDPNFGTSLLLPNRNLLGAYQRLDLGGGYQVTPRVNIYTDIQNLLSEHYFEAFGYPTLPLTVRAGMKLNFGGESWSLK